MRARTSRSRTRFAALAAALALVLALASPAPAGAAVSTQADFRARVVQAADAVKAAHDTVGDRDAMRALIAKVRGLLPAGEKVRDATRTIEVSDPALEELLTALDTAGTRKDRADALARLGRHVATLRGSVGAPSQPVRSDPAALARLLSAVRGGTSAAGDSWLQSLLDRVLAFVQEWLGRMSSTTEGATRLRAAWIAVALVFAALALWVGWRVAWSWRRSLARREAGAAGGRGGAPVVAEAEGLPDDPAAFAERLAAGGHYRDAVRALFGAAARSLGERGLLARTRTRTNAELLAEIRLAAPGLAPALRKLSDAFEFAWYGHRDPGGAGYREARELYRDVLASPETGGGEES